MIRASLSSPRATCVVLPPSASPSALSPCPATQLPHTRFTLGASGHAFPWWSTGRCVARGDVVDVDVKTRIT